MLVLLKLKQKKGGTSSEAHDASQLSGSTDLSMSGSSGYGWLWCHHDCNLCTILLHHLRVLQSFQCSMFKIFYMQKKTLKVFNFV